MEEVMKVIGEKLKELEGKVVVRDYEIENLKRELAERDAIIAAYEKRGEQNDG